MKFISVLIICVMLFCNKKVRIYSILIKQFQVFKNAKTNRVSFWDIICFVILPIILSSILVFSNECLINDKIAEILTTVFAIIFTVLFGFAAILVGKLESDNIIEKRVVEETFISIMSSNIISMIVSILSVTVIYTNNEIANKVLSLFIYSLSFIIIMLLLMISKRTFIIYCNNQEQNTSKESD